MSTEQTFDSVRGDARALQLRLYREIGLAALAAALQGPDPISAVVRAPVRQNPAILVGEDKAS